MKGKILGLINDKNVLWYRFKPEILSLKLIDEIRCAFDEFNEPAIQYDPNNSYEDQLPFRFGFHTDPEIYSIMICEKETINYILIKSHKLYKKVARMVDEKFEFIGYSKSK